MSSQLSVVCSNWQYYDCDTLVVLAYDVRSGVAACLAIQNMSPVLCEELHEDLQKLAYEGKATRVENFATMRPLSHALSSVGLPLHIFDTPADLGPLEIGQGRCMEDGEYVIKDMGDCQNYGPFLGPLI